MVTDPPPVKKPPRIVFPFRTSPDGKRAVEQAAKAEGITPSEWLRRACAERLARQQKPASDRATTRRSAPDATAA